MRGAECGVRSDRLPSANSAFRTPHSALVFHMSNPVDVLAIAAHPDDVELTCGGTLIKTAKAGYRTGILDLTGGETGTRGSRETRATEASAAARTMGVTERANAGLPDAHLQNTDA